jgi:hypothetical protein
MSALAIASPPDVLFDSFVDAVRRTVGRIAGVVEEFAFHFAGRALVRGLIFIEGVSAIAAFPAWHDGLLW